MTKSVQAAYGSAWSAGEESLTLRGKASAPASVATRGVDFTIDKAALLFLLAFEASRGDRPWASAPLLALGDAIREADRRAAEAINPQQEHQWANGSSRERLLRDALTVALDGPEIAAVAAEAEAGYDVSDLVPVQREASDRPLAGGALAGPDGVLVPFCEPGGYSAAEQAIYDVIFPMRRTPGQPLQDYCRVAAALVTERLREQGLLA